MKNRLFIILAVLLCISLNSVVLAKEFNDVSKDNWAYPYIEALSEKGIINGYEDGSFNPNGYVTRGEFEKLVMTSIMGEEYFEKVDSTKYAHWADKYHVEAVKHAYIGPFDLNAGLDMPLNRVKIAEMLSNIVEKNDYDINNEKIKFSDLKNLKKAEKDSINISVSAGLLKGYEDNTFKPIREVTRAEVSTIVYRLLDIISK